MLKSTASVITTLSLIFFVMRGMSPSDRWLFCVTSKAGSHAEMKIVSFTSRISTTSVSAFFVRALASRSSALIKTFNCFVNASEVINWRRFTSIDVAGNETWRSPGEPGGKSRQSYVKEVTESYVPTKNK